MASAYWREREEENRRHLISTEKEMAAHTGNVYEQMMRSAQKEIDSFYQRYATKEGITLAEAKQRISKADMDYLSKQAAKYVGAAQKDMKAGSGVTGGYFSKQANDEMRLYNATMKINRLEFLKGEIGSHLVDGFDKLNRYFDGKFTEQAMEEFRRRAVILGDTVPADLETRAEQIVNGSFRNATYSDRLWQHQDMLRLEIGRQLEQGLLRGAGSRELAREIRKIFGGSRANAERLMRTEMCRISTEVARAHYEKNGNKHFEYMALGMNPCPICEALDGKIFPVADMETGLNAPPMHPNCHCSTGPAYSEEEERLYNDWLDSGAAAEGVSLEGYTESPKMDRLISPKTGGNKVLPEQYDFRRNNSNEVIQKYIQKIEGATSDKEVKRVIENSLRHMPESDMKLIERGLVRVERSANGDSFTAEPTYEGGVKRYTIKLDPNSEHYLAFAHEYAHLSWEENDLISGPFKEVIENYANSMTSIAVGAVDNDNALYAVGISPLSVDPYQGRTYVKETPFGFERDLTSADFVEYISKGYEAYIGEPILLEERDKMLYNYFEKRGLNK